MEGNDISNEIARKLVFVFDDLIGHIPFEEKRAADKARKRKRWEALAGLYEIDTMMAAHLWDIVWRSPYSFDIVSFQTADELWREALTRRLERANVPYSRLEVYRDADEFAHTLAYSPYVIRVYFGTSEWGLKFGQRGEYVSDAQVFQLS
jgi:hypothetical protein